MSSVLGSQKIYLRPIAYVFLFLTLLCTMVALCTSNWYRTVDEHGTTTYAGLWNVCQDEPDNIDTCKFLPKSRENPTKRTLLGIQALYSMSMMALIGACGYPPFFRQMSNGGLKIGFMALLLIIAGICCTISMLTMTHAIHKLNGVTGYSYFIGWGGVGLCFLTAGLIYLASKDIQVYTEKI